MKKLIVIVAMVICSLSLFAAQPDSVKVDINYLIAKIREMQISKEDVVKQANDMITRIDGAIMILDAMRNEQRAKPKTNQKQTEKPKP
jgi:uncharacterized membrane protein YciS (DUF1049 family)